MTIAKVDRGSWYVTGVAAVVVAAGFGVVAAGPRLLADEPKKDDPALSRARDQAQMLDALYKNAVVSITNKYDGPPAIKVAKDVFGAMEKGGWHKAKLVDASGTPQNEANLPQTSFEKRAVKQIQAGKPYYDEVSGNGEGRTLHVATIVPAVTAKCAKCHGVKEGELLGFIRYEIPVK
jgi:hypothetical protein